MSFDLEKQIKPCYSNGKVCVVSLNKTLYVVGLCRGALNFINYENSIVEKTIPKTKDDNIACFDVCQAQLLTGNKSGLTKLWDLKELRCVKTLSLKLGDVSDIVFHPSGKMAAFPNYKNKVQIVAIPHGYITHQFDSSGQLHKAIFSKSHPTSLFCCLFDGKIVVCDLESKPKRVYSNHYSAVTNIRFAGNDGKGNSQMVSCSRDKVVTIWNFSTEKKEFSVFKTVLIKESVEDIIARTNIDEKITKLVFAAESGCLLCFDIEKNKISKTSTQISSCRVLQLIDINSIDSTDLETKDQIKDSVKNSDRPQKEQQILALTEDNCFVQIRGLSLHKVFQASFYHIDNIVATRKDKVVLVTDGSSALKIMNIETNELTPLFGHKNSVEAVSTNLTNDVAFSGCLSGEIKAWDLNSNSCLDTVEAHTSGINCLSLSKAGQILVSAGRDRVVKVWRVRNAQLESRKESLGQPKRKKAKNDIESPDLSVETKNPKHKVENKINAENIKLDFVNAVSVAENDINCVDVSHRETFVAAASMDSDIRVWSLPALKSCRILKGHKKAVWQVNFSSVENLLVSCSSDRTVKLWSITKASCLKTFEGHNESVHISVFSPCGSKILSHSSDSKSVLWEVKSLKSQNSLSGQSVMKRGKNINALAYLKTGDLVTATDNKIDLWCRSNNENPLDKIDEEINLTTKLDDQLVVAGSSNESVNLLIQKEQFRLYVRKKEFSNAMKTGLELKSAKIALEIFKNKEIYQKGVLEKGLSKEAILFLVDIISEWGKFQATTNISQIALHWLLETFNLDELAGIVSTKQIDALVFLSAKKWNRASTLVRDMHFLSLFDFE